MVVVVYNLVEMYEVVRASDLMEVYEVVVGIWELVAA